MVPAWRLTRRDAANLDVERMTLVEIGGLRLAAEFLGDFLARPDAFAFGRFLGNFLHYQRVDLLHSKDQKLRRVTGMSK